jgi:hypothetical protein
MGTAVDIVYSESTAGLVVLAGVVMCVISLRRQLPRHNVLAATALAAGYFWMLETVNAECEWPFGPVLASAGLQLPGGAALTSLLFWLAALFGSRLLARRILKPWRGSRFYGYWMVLLAACLMVLLYRVYMPRPLAQPELEDWFALQQLATFGGCLAALVAVAPWLIVKSPHAPPADWLGPVAWLMLCGYFGLRDLNHGWANGGLAVAVWLSMAAALGLPQMRRKPEHRRASNEAPPSPTPR